jgi:bloom syndrome protein
VPSSLSIWIQRAGRAGRSPQINARAILMVEKSMFRWQKKKRKNNDNDNSDESGASDDDDETDSEEVGRDSETMEWGKKVEPDLRKWIETKECRREIADKYFNNPPDRRREYFHLLLLLTAELTKIT